MANTVTLLNRLAKAKKENTNRIKAIYALERIVARLENHEILSRSLVYKGGYVLYKTIPTDRLTRDVDALAHSISPENVTKMVPLALKTDLGDGVFFHDIQFIALETTGDYSGLRIDAAFSIDEPAIKPEKIKKLSRVHLDIGFGKLLASSVKQPMVVMLNEPGLAVSWAILPLEYIFAEKLQTLVMRGSANSRAKDVYDMWLISKQSIDELKLLVAIDQVFIERQTAKPSGFADFILGLDFQVLRSAWRSVLFAETAMTFDEVVVGLVAYLRNLAVK